MAEPVGGALSRRGFLTAVGAAAGVVTLATAGATVGPLSNLSPLATRRASIGPQGVPVNRSAAGAGVEQAAVDPAYRLEIGSLALSIDDLRALPQTAAVLPIACVEGWSAIGHWSGVRLRDLLERAGIGTDRWVRVESMQASGLYRTSEVSPTHARDDLTLIALRLGDEPLALDHGFPSRLIAPNKPGVMQTKWVNKIVAL